MPLSHPRFLIAAVLTVATVTLTTGCATRTAQNDETAQPEFPTSSEGENVVKVAWYDAPDDRPSRLQSGYRHSIGPADEAGAITIADSSGFTKVSAVGSTPASSADAEDKSDAAAPPVADFSADEDQGTASDGTSSEQDARSSAAAAAAEAGGTDAAEDEGLPWDRYCAADSSETAHITDEEFAAIHAWQDRHQRVAPEGYEPCTVLK